MQPLPHAVLQPLPPSQGLASSWATVVGCHGGQCSSPQLSCGRVAPQRASGPQSAPSLSAALVCAAREVNARAPDKVVTREQAMSTFVRFAMEHRMVIGLTYLRTEVGQSERRHVLRNVGRGKYALCVGIPLRRPPLRLTARRVTPACGPPPPITDHIEDDYTCTTRASRMRCDCEH